MMEGALELSFVRNILSVKSDPNMRGNVLSQNLNEETLQRM